MCLRLIVQTKEQKRHLFDERVGVFKCFLVINAEKSD